LQLLQEADRLRRVALTFGQISTPWWKPFRAK